MDSRSIIIVLFISMCIAIFHGCGAKKTEINPMANFANMDMKLPEDAVIRRDMTNQTIFLIQGEDLSKNLSKNKIFKELVSNNQHEDIAIAFIMAYRSLFKLRQPDKELKVKTSSIDDLGNRHIKFGQIFKKIPARACEIIIHMNKKNRIYKAQGRYIPTPENMNVNPVLEQKQALENTARTLESKTGCPECSVKLVIFAPPSDQPRLAYEIHTARGLTDRWVFMVDATDGKILQKRSLIRTHKW